MLKLFHIVAPSAAYFGQKDIQQALILQKMAADLSLDLKVEIVETVREPSGLALSSRNRYLSDDEKERAVALQRALFNAKAALTEGQRSATALKSMMGKEINASRPQRIDYIEIVDRQTLEPIEQIDAPVVIALAVVYGRTRLIDNVLAEPNTF